MSAAALQRLSALSGADSRTILGLMSGTSLDGLDMALCRVTGSGFDTKAECTHFHTAPFTDEFRGDVLSVFAKKSVDLEQLTLLHRLIADVHAELINATLNAWGVSVSDVDLLASHGQTIYHAPLSLHGKAAYGNATLQIGDGDHLAQRTGLITCSDFRQKHIAAGGEGAPLAVYGDLLVLSHESEARILVNIGGIANYTLLPALNEKTPAFSSDIGPGNTLMDAVVRQHFSPKTFDKDAILARQGKVHEKLLAALKETPFFKSPTPKTTGPEEFSLKWLDNKVSSTAPDISPMDTLATLNRFSAETIATALSNAHPTATIYLSGGGAQNPLLRENLAKLLPHRTISTTDALGIDPDSKEAVLFAVLANELVAGDPTVLEGHLDGAPSVSMGKISLPG